MAGWPQESWDVGSMLRRSNISLLASGRDLSREGVAGPTAATGLGRRAPHPKLPNAITPKHKQSHQPLLSSLYHPPRPPESPISNQSSIHPCNHPAARAGTHQHHSFAVFNSQVFAIMYMAKILVTEQELLSKLTVSSLG